MQTAVNKLSSVFVIRCLKALLLSFSRSVHLLFEDACRTAECFGWKSKHYSPCRIRWQSYWWVISIHWGIHKTVSIFLLSFILTVDTSIAKAGQSHLAFQPEVPIKEMAVTYTSLCWNDSKFFLALNSVTTHCLYPLLNKPNTMKLAPTFLVPPALPKLSSKSINAISAISICRINPHFLNQQSTYQKYQKGQKIKHCKRKTAGFKQQPRRQHRHAPIFKLFINNDELLFYPPFHSAFLSVISCSHL